MKIEILLADDQFMILEGIKAVLEPEPEIEVVGTAQDGQSAIALVKKLRPDILLMDIEMPNMNGISATKYICKYFPNTKVIVLTSHKNQDYIAEALLAGASGYLWKGNLIADLKQEIYSFGEGYSGVKARLLNNAQTQMPKRTSDDRLTQADQKESPARVIEYREKIVYFKKHRKNIYNPTVNQKQQRSHKTLNIQTANANITKASLAARSKPLTGKRIKVTNLKTYSRSKYNRRKYLRKIIWLLLAILSIVLSIVFF